jgi:hypothetical protein
VWPVTVAEVTGETPSFTVVQVAPASPLMRTTQSVMAAPSSDAGEIRSRPDFRLPVSLFPL